MNVKCPTCGGLTYLVEPIENQPLMEDYCPSCDELKAVDGAGKIHSTIDNVLLLPCDDWRIDGNILKVWMRGQWLAIGVANSPCSL